MERKSMGSFIAVLRKANGYTQRELAEKLNVSDKAVSRWEREESAPDLMLIPVIAEIFNVTTDELLRGERNASGAPSASIEPKAEKQLHFLLNHGVMKFKNTVFISIASALIGLIFLFAISYGFYQPVIGFCAALLFMIISAVITMIACMKWKEAIHHNEIIADTPDCFNAKKSVFQYAFAAFYTDFALILIALPFVIFSDSIYVYTVISFQTFLQKLPAIFFFSILALVIGYPVFQKICLKEAAFFPFSKPGQITWIHLGLGIIFFILCYCSQTGLEHPLISVSAFITLLTAVIIIPILAVREKAQWKKIVLSGVRNLVLIVALTMILNSQVYPYTDYPNTNTDAVYVVSDNGAIGSIGFLLAAFDLLLSFLVKTTQLKKER